MGLVWGIKSWGPRAMKKLLRAASVLALGVFAYPVTAAEFSFLQEGWSDGGVFSGSFVAEDLNNDGQISSFDNEVTSFNASYLSSQFFSITFDSLEAGPFGFEGPGNELGGAPTGLVFTLDGSGQLGDDSFGNLEGLGVYGRSSGSDFGNDLFLAVGPGPFNQCDGTTVCGGVFNAFDVAEPIFVATATAAPVEEMVRFDELPLIDELPTITDPNSFLPEERALSTNTNAITVSGDDLGDPEGLFESSPVLPDDVNDGGGFVFNLEDIRNLPGRIFFIDPEIATGYTYEITGDLFFSVQAPSLGAVADGDGEYLLSYEQGGSMFEQVLEAGDIFEFGPDGVSSFTITGIDPALMLDPTNVNAFVTGVSVVNGGIPGTITQTPITTDVNAVPLPASGVLLLSGIAGFAFLRRRREALRG